LLVDLLDAGRIGHALGKPGYNGCDRIARHKARQSEIQHESKNKSDYKPKKLVKEVPSIAFQCNTSSELLMNTYQKHY
jgi:hypothetical protein